MIEIMGEVNFHAKFNTVRDIREFLATLEQYGVQDDAALLDGYADICYRGDVEPIECGDHKPWIDGRHFDFLILSHTHEDEEESVNADDMMEPLEYSEGKFEDKS